MSWPVLVFDIESIPDIEGLRALRDAGSEVSDAQLYAAWQQERKDQNLSDFMLELNKSGLTGVYSLGRGPEGEDFVMERRAATPLPLRIWHTLTYEANDPAGATAPRGAGGSSQ